MPRACVELAPAKVNLTLRVIARRPDGYHDIESLVAFSDVGDTVRFTPGRELALAVNGPTAGASGEVADNLVLKAARALAERVPGLALGEFVLTKRLPVAAGLGGGSADAAAALRLLARANDLAREDPRLFAAARASGADVPVCLDPRPRIMRGIGDILSKPLDLPPLPAVLVNPRVAVPTKEVFAALRLASSPPPAGETGLRIATDTPAMLPPPQELTQVSAGRGRREEAHRMLVAALVADRNDLEAPAIKLQPVIAEVLAALGRSEGCRLTRMSGSGATCFGLFDSKREAALAARALRAAHSRWWVRASTLG